MSLDSSDEEENLQLLREAADQQFINDSMFKFDNTITKNVINQRCRPPSLRQTKQEDQFNILYVTPQFQKHVAKKLEHILDMQLVNSMTENMNTHVVKTEHEKCRIKLFKESKHFITLESQQNKAPTNKRVHIKKRLLEQDGDEVSRAMAASVNPEDILSKKDTIFWSNRSKAKVFKYRKMKNGQLVHIDNV